MDGEGSLTVQPVMRLRLYAAIVVAAGVLAYANALSNPFVLDDESSVVQNGDIRSLTNLGRVLFPSANSPVAGRPLVSLSFALNYAAGGLDPRGYHAVNLAHARAVCAADSGSGSPDAAAAVTRRPVGQVPRPRSDSPWRCCGSCTR